MSVTTWQNAYDEEEIFSQLEFAGWNPIWKGSDDARRQEQKPWIAAEDGYGSMCADGDFTNEIRNRNPELSVEVIEDNLSKVNIDYGDRVVISMYEPYTDGDVVMVRINGLWKLMLYLRDDYGEWLMVPDDSRKPVLLDNEMKQHVIGKVKECRKRNISMPFRSMKRVLEMHHDELMQQTLGNGAKGGKGKGERKLNYVAPKLALQEVMKQKWIDNIVSNKNKYGLIWRTTMIEDLMKSEYAKGIATDWAVEAKRAKVKCALIGAMKDAGVLKDNYNQMAKKLAVDSLPASSLARYMGDGKKQEYFGWLADYVKLREQQ